MLKRNVYN